MINVKHEVDYIKAAMTPLQALFVVNTMSTFHHKLNTNSSPPTSKFMYRLPVKSDVQLLNSSKKKNTVCFNKSACYISNVALTYN